ncbi:MAG: hypothetical protein RLY57_617 [Candidatus Parcubacteria bacterium]
MKKLLAYIFLSIGFLSIAPQFLFAAQYKEETVSGDYTKTISALISAKKAGYYNNDGTLINDYGDSPGGAITKPGYIAEMYDNTYYKTDGNLVFVYDAGQGGVVDATEANPNKPQNDDRIVGMYYKNGDQLVFVDAGNRLAGVPGSAFDSEPSKDKEFVYAMGKRFGFANDAANADAYESIFNKRANQVSFGSDKSIKDRQQETAGIAKDAVTLNGEIDAIQKQLTELKKDPEANAEEITALENQLKDKTEQRDKLKQTNAENVAAITSAGAAAEKKLAGPTPDNFASLGLCVPTIHWNASVEWDPKACLAGLVNLGIQVVSVPFTWSAGLLDYVTNFTVRDFGVYFSKGGKLYNSVNNVWQLMKNICNIFFIVALVYIAIKTMLNADGFQEKQRLINVIIFAFLINFSMFFSKVMIDVSNTASLQVFNVLVQTANKQTGLSDVKQIAQNTTAGSPVAAATVSQSSLADVFLSNMQIQRFVINSSGGGLGFNNLDYGFIAVYGLFTIIFIIIATIVIAVIAGMMTIRFLVLVLLLMTSPIAYVGTFVPAAIGSYSQMWWQKLKDNLTFLPVLMLMFYITMQFTQFATAQVTTNANDYISLIFAYVMTIAMLVISLSVAKSVGGSAGAADFGSKWAKAAIGGATFGLAARVGRRAAGATGYLANKSGVSGLTKRIANSNSLLFRATGAGALARQALKGGEKLQNATFDARNTGAAKNLGLGEGLKDGYKKGIVEANEKLAKEKIEYAKKQTEKSDKQKADEEIYKQYERAQKNLKDNTDSEDKYQKALDEAQKKIDGAEDHIDNEIKKEQSEIDKQLLENEKELRDLEKVLTDAAATKEQKEAAQKEKTKRDGRKTDLEDRKVKVAGEKDARLEAERKKINIEFKEAEESLKAVRKAKDQVKKDAEDAEAVVKSFGYKPDDLKKQVDDADKVIKQKKKEYIAHLESNARKTFGSNNLSFVPSEQTDAYRAKLAEELKQLYKSSEDKELKKALDLIKKQAKEDEKKEEKKDDKK